MSAEDYNKETFCGIRITTENFEEVFVSALYIKCIHTVLSKFGYSEYETIIVEFNPNFATEKPEALERLQIRNDITYIDIICKDKNKNLEIEVPYEEDDLGFNQLQNINIYSQGEIILKINKNRGYIQ